MALFEIAAFACLATARTAEAFEKIGVVLMHGEEGAPGRVINRLGDKLGKAGYLVMKPDMCWSARRSYEQEFPACLAAVDDAIVKLRNIGAARIVVGGFSLGGAAAIAYGAAHPELLGVFALAPAHDPDAMVEAASIKDSVAKAEKLVAQGKGDEQANFDDVAIGPSGAYMNEIATTPAIYLSFFGPSSQAAIARNAAQLALPLLWVAGRDDPTQAREPGDAFAKAPQNPLSRYVTVAGGHLATPEAASDALIGWLRDLAK